jgi:predicted GNAT family acetyltransferase
MLRLDQHPDADAFLAAAGGYLAAREAEHNLMLGIASQLRRDPAAYDGPPYLAVLSAGDRVVGAALRTPPYNLILSVIDEPAAIPSLVDDVAHEPLPGVTGPPEMARAFATAFVAAHGGGWGAAMDERIYRLEAVVPPRPAPGGFRLAEAPDRPLVERWFIAFGAEALDDDDAERVTRGLDDWEAGTGRQLWLWEDGGEPVSLAGAGGETPHGIRIGPVYTPPQHRGRGYASNLTAAVSQAMLDEGRRFCFLYTNVANPTSNRIYRAIGYEPVTDALMIRFRA